MFPQIALLNDVSPGATDVIFGRDSTPLSIMFVTIDSAIKISCRSMVSGLIGWFLKSLLKRYLNINKHTPIEYAVINVESRNPCGILTIKN